MAWDQLLTGVLSSVASGSVLLIATLGLAVVFGLMGVVNLAHGEFIMFGAYAALTAVRAGVPFPLAVALAALAAAAFGALVEWLIVRRLHGRPFDTLLAMWGLSLALYQSAVLLFGTVTPGIGMPASNVRIGDYTISSYLLFLIVVAAVLIAAVYALLTRTNYGLMARAAIQDPTTAAAMGVRTVRINNLTFALGCGLAGLAGAILVPAVPATPSMGFAFGIKAFLAVVVAGPVTLAGTIAAGGILGSAASAVASVWSTVAGDVVFFVITLVALRAWPQGISERWRLKL
ncbi:branched-chain amino acid ABC transporter permease [Variovorax sp.]|jgi:urea transport system permease protein|uniref:branched-chain amino acid ABC transporter permease n=1 Tax=Variovorax sp. TaxID=1871043 RepID=UPI0037DA1250